LIDERGTVQQKSAQLDWRANMDDERPEPDYRKLIAWQRAMGLTVQVYDATDRQPDDEIMHGLAGDLRRAATTIPSKIAFGAGTGDPFMFLDSLDLADQARRELNVLLALARHRDIVVFGPGADLERRTEEVGTLIAELRRNLRGEPEGETFARG
jgi:four helix bundle protein